MLSLPIARSAIFVLVRPHYPENVGAVARAMKVMGLTRLVLVKPGRIAVPEHEMARRMAVKSLDVLAAAVARAKGPALREHIARLERGLQTLQLSPDAE